MSRASNEWVCWCKVDSLGGRPKPEKVYNPTTKKMEKTGKMIEPVKASDNVSYIERKGETIAAGCNLPSLGEAFSEVFGAPFSAGERSRITRRFVGIENEERAVRWDSRTGYSVKMTIPNSIPAGRLADLAHDVISLVLDGKHEYAFSVHRGGISAKDRAAMNAKERDPITGQMRLTPHARAVRKVLRSQDNRHIHFVFRERQIGEKSKVRWMQQKRYGVMALRSCPEDPDGEREHHGFDDALGEILSQKYGFTIVKKTYADGRRKTVSQSKYKADQKQKIRDIEKQEISKDMAEIVTNYKHTYQQLETRKAGIKDQINELERAPETPATPADIIEREARDALAGEKDPDDAKKAPHTHTTHTHDDDDMSGGMGRGMDR